MGETVTMRRRAVHYGVALALMLAAAQAAAQPTQARIAYAAGLARDLDFPAAAAALTSESIPQMALYKPEGAGPFPALVLVHQCAGLGQGARRNGAMLAWARRAVEQGYVALLIDSLGPRGALTVCFGPQAGVNLARGAKDALQAAAYLRRFEFVEPSRIAIAGYSWGGMVALLASSRLWREALVPDARFAAAVAFYPGCFTLRPPGGMSYETVNADIERPLLALMGSDDTETPADECMSKLGAARAAGAPVRWHLFPATTHCWDCARLDGVTRFTVRGTRVTYRYDPAVTGESARRMFDFLAEVMPAVSRRPRD